MNDYHKGVLIVASGALLYAPDSLMLRLMAMEQWPTMFWRGLIAGSILTVAMLIARGRQYPADIRALGRTGLAFLVVYGTVNFLFVFAVRETTVANTLFILSTSPIFSSLISWVWLKEPPDRRTIRTIVLAMIGIGTIAGGHMVTGEPRVGTFWGDMSALAGAFGLALGFNIARSKREYSMTPMIGPAGLIGAAVAFAMATDVTPPPDAIAPMLIMGILLTPLATWFLTIGPRYIPAPEVSLLMLIEAVIGPLIVWWALSEYPGNMTLIGGTIVLGAIFWSSYERLRER
ncbi:MAG: DMT family transporter [Pikeienuella sp.]